jgi:hypothetical protein
MAVISDAMASVGLRAWKETRHYERTLLALVQADPGLTRSAAARIVNAQLEATDGVGIRRGRALVASPIPTSHEGRVREAAYLMWESAGKLDDCDVDFWFMAERWVIGEALGEDLPIRMRNLTTPLNEGID